MTDPALLARGILRDAPDGPLVEVDGGEAWRPPGPIWPGYLLHWTDVRVRVSALAQHDYDTGAPILLLGPDDPGPAAPFVSLYYNERLTGYFASLFGHLAINVDGRVFNFSHLLNETEEMTAEEFLYRPALGEFAAHPDTRAFNLDDPARPYYDKFGRRFMRSIHELRILGLDGTALAEHLRCEIANVHATPVDPRRPHKYRDFNFLTRSCVTAIRDALQCAGLPGVRGVLPRELFLCTAHEVLVRQRAGRLSGQIAVLEQIKVPQRAFSRPSPILNPLNRWRRARAARVPGGEALASPAIAGSGDEALLRPPTDPGKA